MVRADDLHCANATVTGGFWLERQNAVREGVMVSPMVRELLAQHAAGLNKPERIWGAGLAKWLEAMSYMQCAQPDAALKAQIDACIDCLISDQEADGYINSCFSGEPQKLIRYTNHELYGLGHWIEAALAYRCATGSDRLLNAVQKYVDLADRVFRREHSAPFDTPGHEEIELALCRLYRVTGSRQALELARYFVEKRGNGERIAPYEKFGQADYSQAHAPVREQLTAEGHAVRATYLYCAMADLAVEERDDALKRACVALMDDIVTRKLYVTGGIGSSWRGEAFTLPYDLMNRTAYAETCASIGLALFARRMFWLCPDGRYGDIVETALYNGMLGSMSLDGSAYFYENPLEVQPQLYHQNNHYATERDHMGFVQRQTKLDCACCPPNVARTVMNVLQFAYSETDDTLFFHQYLSYRADTAFGAVAQETAYPYAGLVETVLGAGGDYQVAFRVPDWASGFSLRVNGQRAEPTLRMGYAYLRRAWQAGDRLCLELPMETRVEEARPELHDDCGRVCVLRGPLTYCLEEADNGACLKDIRLPENAAFAEVASGLSGIPALRCTGYRRVWRDDGLYRAGRSALQAVPVTFVPFFARLNRGEGEMIVWVLSK